MSERSTTRRDLLKAAGISLAAGWLGGASVLGKPQDAPPTVKRKRAFRLAHLTDIHVQPERKADGGMSACLKHVESLSDKPDLILTGGDLVMDSFDAGEARTKTQWDIFTRLIKDDTGIRVRHTLGNHDLWGGNKKKSKTTGQEPQWGKKWACDLLGLEKPYYSFDAGGWHMIVLDSVTVKDDGYIARLDEVQLDWLGRDIAAVAAKTPILICSHIPILTACVMLTSKYDEKITEHKVGGSVMHLEAIKLKDLFLKHPNVKLCISGHLHLIERIDFNGVSYVCDGAVSAGWWRGKNDETDFGYGVFDLYDDGSFEHQYVTYGWKASE